MKTIYLRRKASGNFEIVTGKYNQAQYTHKFSTWKALKSFTEFNVNGNFCEKLYGAKIIKAEYRLSNTYFSSFEELKTFIKNQTQKNHEFKTKI